MRQATRLATRQACSLPASSCCRAALSAAQQLTATHSLNRLPAARRPRPCRLPARRSPGQRPLGWRP